ncbi:hypothetical protein N7448_002375 [Penicillium atrosanguineum]|uniref:Apple domain-containing protein n=1 Tax=Penicillium atrosanguineum TaxID=1132637 RepID=A0A9W9LAP9_9EURO|nr:uncharacterized protein N7443_005777 [Penicillium atrosanguineum]KAJ5128658.1 hypothetical protein N7526_006824 [Penicillium atrosanguineum]KAJ5144983.1 hypothetical protein N7448_002375 [Penicillium atrosanguineum]KAJ5300775.1 hypothetical protein N7443_005777 [Penicillium atrosanguineum]KAJ5311417.1 hypothetical protein N7476_007277 [Penicillium atrosanguineum]
MKLHYLIQGLCFLTAVEAQTAKDDYDALCDSRDEDILTGGNGENFAYVCGMTAKGGRNNIIDTLENVGSSSACADSCAAVDECNGSTWNYLLKSCLLHRDAEDIKNRRGGLLLRRADRRPSADCTVIQNELKECEDAEIILQDDLNTCKTAHTTSEKVNTDLEDKLEACEFERDLLESEAATTQDCESAKGQIEDLNQQVEQCKSDALSTALDLHECQNIAASGALELQQCKNAAATNSLELQQCKNSAASSSLELQQCQTTASSGALELQQCKSSAASTSLELQQCKAAASSSGLPAFKDCTTGGDGQILKIGSRNFKQKCNVSMAKSQMPLRRVVKPGLNRLECALICALDAGCQNVYFVRSTSTVGECQLQQQNIESRLGRGEDIDYIPV